MVGIGAVAPDVRCRRLRMTYPFQNVVFLSQRVPHPPDRGDRISTSHLLRHFREEGCRLRIGCFAEDDRDERSADELRSFAAEVCCPRIEPGKRRLWSLRGLLTGEPLTLPYFRHHELRCAIDRWMREDPPDLVFLYSSSMGQYVEAYPRPLRVMHFAELDSDKWAQYAAKSGLAGRFIYGREARELLKYEQRIARAFDTSLVVSDVERELFRKLIPDVDPIVIPNGVEVGHFTSAGDGMREPHTVVFTGVMDYEPNVDGVLWFAESCWPQLRAEFPDARFLVVGNRPTAAIQALDGRHGITVTGWVETTPPYFDRATVAIAPLRLARGLQNKVLEAMSMGLPVVATQKASQGLGQVPADTLSVADDPAAITSEVRRLWKDPAGARATGARAAAYVREHFLWSHMFERLDDALGRAAARR
ncbi:MAG: TIGR03087 family PEP-CTERM/XrtA system glycosyltransferase [Planctomycetota bacterium]